MIRLAAILALFLAYQPSWAATFTFHIASDPVSLDPLKSNGSWNSFLHFNLYRSFFKYDGRRLVSEYAKKCEWVSRHELHCEMKLNQKYSNGEAILIEDYIRPFFDAFDAESTPKAKSELIYLKNAKKIFEGKSLVSTLGVEAHKKSKDKIVFYFDRHDSDFLFRLSNPIFSPRPSKKIAHDERARYYATGPYSLSDFKSLKSVDLLPNKYFLNSNSKRPPVTAFIVNSESTALNLYLKDKLVFLRRIPQDQYSAIIKNPELKNHIHYAPQLRMDYLGFSGDLENEVELRKALIYGLDYSQLQLLLSAKGRPGCYSVSKEYYDGKSICYDFDLKKAREILTKVPLDKKNKVYTLYYSQQGGDDIERSMSWIQNQWKKNLGLNILLQPKEQTELTVFIRSKKADIFRRGVPVDTPSCAGALETFNENHPDNFLQINSKKLSQLLSQFNDLKPLSPASKIKCREALLELLAFDRFIPLGEFFFVVLAQPRFTGWTLNELNQLDLSNLRIAQ